MLRFGAAIVVVADHVMSPSVTGSRSSFQNYGSDAVMIFFVLSGFVICLTQDRHPNFADYASARLARLWSVIIPAVFLTIVFDSLCYAINSGYYLHWWMQNPIKLAACPFIDIIFLDEIWGRDGSVASNAVICSIGYEAMYYVVYGAMSYLPLVIGAPIAGLALLVKGPLVAAYYLIWHLGVVACRLCAGTRTRPLLGLALTTTSIAAYVSLNLDARTEIGGLFSPRLRAYYGEAFFHGEEAEFRFVVGLLTFFLMISLFHLTGSRTISTVLKSAARPIRKLADTTFSIYLLHVPILVLITAIVGFPLNRDYGIAWTALAGGIALLFGLVIENRKKEWRVLTDYLIAKVVSLTRRLVARTRPQVALDGSGHGAGQGGTRTPEI